MDCVDELAISIQYYGCAWHDELVELISANLASCFCYIFGHQPCPPCSNYSKNMGLDLAKYSRTSYISSWKLLITTSRCERLLLPGVWMWILLLDLSKNKCDASMFNQIGEYICCGNRTGPDYWHNPTTHFPCQRLHFLHSRILITWQLHHYELFFYGYRQMFELGSILLHCKVFKRA